MVRVPAVLKVKLDKVRVPATKVMLPAVPPLSSAIVALASVVVIVTLGVAGVCTFHFGVPVFSGSPLANPCPPGCAGGGGGGFPPGGARGGDFARGIDLVVVAPAP